MKMKYKLDRNENIYEWNKEWNQIQYQIYVICKVRKI